MQIKHLSLPPIGTNCYIIINEETNECLIVDPGSSPERIKAAVDELKLTPVAILLTHGHFDHAGAADEVSKLFDIKIYAHEDEKETLENPENNLSGNFMFEPVKYHADVYLKDGQEVDLAGLHFRVIFTPGHTVGGCCYYFSYQSVLFSGDTLFYGAIGRTDFPGGSMSTLVNCVRDKLMVLPEDTVVYPGHDEATSIEEERIHNPYI